MKFVEVKEVPETRRRNDGKDLKAYFDEFMSMNSKVAKVDFNEHEYKNIITAYTVLKHAAKRWAVPITVTKRKDEIYFIRRDM